MGFFIRELTEDVQYVVEAAADGKKNMYVEGIYLQSGIPNRNKRIYPTEILANEVARYVKEHVDRGSAWGELGHPTGPAINLDRVSHLITSLKQDGKNFVGRSRLAETPFGNIARGLIESGGRIGMSSRGIGSLKPNSQGIMEVQGDFRLAAGADIVADPSAPDAWVQGVMESAQWVMDPSGHWRQVGEIVETVKKLSPRQIEERATELFCQYVKQLSKATKK